MTTEIHHGPPGSYKSFTLVQRFAIPALLAGRTVVTNIRGLDSFERIESAFPDYEFPSEARLIWLNTAHADQRLKMACWFHWVPFGALLVIDEIQQIYPQRRDFKLESLDTWKPAPGDVIDDVPLDEGRPYDIFVAIDKQRHYNWDLYASTTNIAKVNKEFRQVSEWAFRHRNISGILPWLTHTWIEHQHDAENNGKTAASRAGAPVQYKADPRVFACYDSTATGEHVKANTGRGALTDPKILLIIAAVGVSMAVFLFTLSARANAKASGQADAPPAQVDTPPVAPSNSPPLPVLSPGTPNVPPVQTAVAAASSPLKRSISDTLPAWSLQGIKPAELSELPTFCRPGKHSVHCVLPRLLEYYSVIVLMSNRICDDTVCHFYFDIITPEPPSTNKAASALPPLLVSSSAPPR